MYALKTIFFVAFSFIQVFTLSAQSTNIISYQDFEKIKFNSHTVKQLIEVSNYESFLESNYGSPVRKQCSDNPMMPKGCNIYYDGFMLGFAYENVLLDLTISGGSHALIYNNKQLRVGMSTYELRGIFPDSYNNRYNVTRGGTEHTFMRVVVGQQYSDMLILFKLNTSLNTVTEIHIGTGGEQ